MPLLVRQSQQNVGREKQSESRRRREAKRVFRHAKFNPTHAQILLRGEFNATHGCEVQRLCRELDVASDIELETYLPLWRHTLPAPEPVKWRRHEFEIITELSSIEATRARFEAMFRSA